MKFLAKQILIHVNSYDHCFSKRDRTGNWVDKRSTWLFCLDEEQNSQNWQQEKSNESVRRILTIFFI